MKCGQLFGDYNHLLPHCITAIPGRRTRPTTTTRYLGVVAASACMIRVRRAQASDDLWHVPSPTSPSATAFPWIKQRPPDTDTIIARRPTTTTLHPETLSVLSCAGVPCHAATNKHQFYITDARVVDGLRRVLRVSLNHCHRYHDAPQYPASRHSRLARPTESDCC